MTRTPDAATALGPDHFVAATESPTRHAEQMSGPRRFFIVDMLAAKALLDWSEPLQLKLEVQADGTYDLIARTV